MLDSKLSPTSTPKASLDAVDMNILRRFTERDGAGLVRVLRAASGPQGVAAAERLLDCLWSLQPQRESVGASLRDLVQIFEALPATVDRPAERAEEHAEDLDNAIRYFGARLTDLSRSITTL